MPTYCQHRPISLLARPHAHAHAHAHSCSRPHAHAHAHTHTHTHTHGSDDFSAADMPSPLVQHLRRAESPYLVAVQAYAMTEASHQMTSNPLPEVGPHKPGTVGTAQGSVKVRDQSSARRELPPHMHTTERLQVPKPSAAPRLGPRSCPGPPLKALRHKFLKAISHSCRTHLCELRWVSWMARIS